MPFTASHVAAVLPFARTPLIPSALVVGSLVPDLPVLFQLPFYANTHSVWGVFVTNAAVGFGLLVVWYLLLAEPLYAMSPSILRQRLPVPDPGSVLRATDWPRRLLLTYASLVIGAATHVTWDAFTHPYRWGSQHIDWLATAHGPMLGTSWAQYGSTVLGAFVIAVWLILWWRRTEPRDAAAADSPVAALALGRAASWAIWLLPLMAGASAAAFVARIVLAGGAGPLETAFWIGSYGASTSLTVVVALALGWQLRRVLRTD